MVAVGVFITVHVFCRIELHDLNQKSNIIRNNLLCVYFYKLHFNIISEGSRAFLILLLATLWTGRIKLLNFLQISSQWLPESLNCRMIFYYRSLPIFQTNYLGIRVRDSNPLVLCLKKSRFEFAVCDFMAGKFGIEPNVTIRFAVRIFKQNSFAFPLFCVRGRTWTSNVPVPYRSIIAVKNFKQVFAFCITGVSTNFTTLTFNFYKDK